jgi:hypothetical protein
MVGRKSNNAEQRPSLGTAILRMLSSNVFHKKPEYLIHCISVVWCPHDLDTITLILPLLSAGRVSCPRSISRSLAGRSRRLRRCRALQPRARSIESWLNLTFPAGFTSCNRRCRERAKSCGKDVGLVWGLKGIGVKTRSPGFPRTGVMGFRRFSESSHGKIIPFAIMRDFTGARRC